MSRLSVRAVVSAAAVAAMVLATVSGGAHSGEDTIKRSGSRYVQTIDRSFDIDPGGLLSVEAPGGSIGVKTWNKNSVRVVIERKVKTRSEEDARELLMDYPTTVKQVEDEIRVRTKFAGRWDDHDRIEASYEITVPSRFNVDLETAGGSIEVDDLEGDVLAQTAGGSIVVGEIMGDADLKTAGGSIKLAGGGNRTVAKTAGGSIDVGECRGDVFAETSGGSITVDGAEGAIEAETSGGSIRLGPASGDIEANTAGGSIKVGSAGGKVRAATSGGSIAVDGSQGPVNVATSGGSIDVRDARSGVSAKTSSGSVTAELNFGKGADATSELETSGGDVTVYLPANLSATIEARIDRTRDRYKIRSEFPMEIHISGDRARATLKLGGGGDKIRLRTREGDIHIKKL